VAKAANMVVSEIKSMQTAPASQEELVRVKALLLRQIPLNESSVDDIAHGLLGRVDLNLPLDEPTNAARRYIGLSPRTCRQHFASGCGRTTWFASARVRRRSKPHVGVTLAV